MIVRIIDVETTGVPSETESHALVEVGYTDVTRVGDEWVVGATTSHLVNPGRPIPPESSAVHHITDAMVRDAISPDQACLLMASGDVDAYVAHQLDFEKQFFGGGSKPMVCTYKAALRIFSDSPVHSNQGLRYFLKMDDEAGFEPERAMPPHRAGPDSYVTAWLATKIFESTDFDALVRWSKGPALLIKCWMRKHRGKTWEEIARTDKGYLQWILRDVHDDRDVRATAKYWLNKTAAPTDGEVQ